MTGGKKTNFPNEKKIQKFHYYYQHNNGRTTKRGDSRG